MQNLLSLSLSSTPIYYRSIEISATLHFAGCAAIYQHRIRRDRFPIKEAHFDKKGRFTLIFYIVEPLENTPHFSIRRNDLESMSHHVPPTLNTTADYRDYVGLLKQSNH